MACEGLNELHRENTQRGTHSPKRIPLSFRHCAIAAAIWPEVTCHAQMSSCRQQRALHGEMTRVQPPGAALDRRKTRMSAVSPDRSHDKAISGGPKTQLASVLIFASCFLSKVVIACVPGDVIQHGSLQERGIRPPAAHRCVVTRQSGCSGVSHQMIVVSHDRSGGIFPDPTGEQSGMQRMSCTTHTASHPIARIPSTSNQALQIICIACPRCSHSATRVAQRSADDLHCSDF